MFKKGFTLQELLITMAIIGVVAAITAPAIMNIVPDKKKAMYLKTYNTITTLTDEMLSDPSLYWSITDSENGNRYGLSNTEQPQVEPYVRMDDWSGNSKFATILHEKLNTNSDIECNNNGLVVGGGIGSTCTFSTIDGTYWSIRSTIGGVAWAPNDNNVDSDFYANHVITVDVDPNDESNACIYSDECTSPAQFVFYIDTYGGVSACDAMGQAYLQNPTNLHATAEDRDRAADILVSDEYKDQLSKWNFKSLEDFKVDLGDLKL